ncbi:acetyl-CoA carboxylase biotin carboxylase subunit [Congregibacter sp.]|uniref:acetyl/propionyl/methylcrotonyl-CoA carboxylase subunit alpha n=1 Tax=Congregibacter sp. TaxID=2744308 RepID=UPI00385D267A
MFNRILIANRGEIACRVIHTARALGIRTVAVYSDADRNALHVQLADQAVHIGESAATLSYLDQDKILKAAQETSSEAIHPGYGFLSENAAFARACDAAGIAFIGPSASAIESMGSKSRAKSIMGKAGVPLIPGYHGDDQSDEILRREADAMGYPVLLKATAGGGGKGMRAVHSSGEFTEALTAARRESSASFGDDRMLIEKLIQRPRHVEVQVFCDGHSNGVYLAERDCSIQRRHQKVIEEAPAPGLSEDLRRAMGEAAVDAARAIDYLGAGTVEFLLDASGQFFFMEMNTRLQVEHPVTEMITGQDLVEWQLRVAAGDPLPLSQSDIRIDGHAMEARIYAEDTEQGFLPSTGVINYLRLPPEGPSLRIDTGVIEGSEISPYYDPMIAKLIVHGDTREEARRRLTSALSAFRVAGPASNIAFLYNIASLPAFAHCDLDTHFIERHNEDLFRAPPAQKNRDLAAAALSLLSLRQKANQSPGNDRFSPWADSRGWRMNTPHSQRFDVLCHGEEYLVELVDRGEYLELLLDDETATIRGNLQDDVLMLELDGHRYRGSFAREDGEYTVFWDDGAFHFAEKQLTVLDSSAAAAGDSDFGAPMHGTVVALLVEPGTDVSAGDPVVVIEAMKMEQTLRAPSPGKVKGFRFNPGDLVDRGASLVDFEAESAQ